MGWREKRKEISNKKWIVSGKVTLPWGKVGIYQADDLTTTKQVSPDWLLTGHIPGGAETAIMLGIKSWFADMVLSTSDSILDLLFLC